MKKTIKIWLILALCLAFCLSFAILASAETTACVNSHTYDNECDKECNVCAMLRIVPHKNDDGNDVCDLCQATLCDHITVPGLIDFLGCDKPRKCRLCGESDSPAGHYWASATCTASRVCSTCGASDGVSLGHKWSGGSCVDSAVCSVCAETKAPTGHRYDNACDAECNVCNSPRTVKHVDLNGDMICDLCKTTIPEDGLNGGEIAVIIVIPVCSIAAGVGVYILLTKMKKKKSLSEKKDNAQNTKDKK